MLLFITVSGTTETQRSVSFYRIPSVQSNPTYLEKLGDVVPAGKGMKDVQLLVVDRQDKSKICGIGEPGEIYVRVGSADCSKGIPNLIFLGRGSC